MIVERLAKLKTGIEKACERAGRDPEGVRLLAVTKGHSVEQIAQAYDLGVRDFGENYATEMARKQVALEKRCPELRWHFIGRIQSNKLRAISTASWIHTLCEWRQAEALTRLTSQTTPRRVLMQVNLDKDPHRRGIYLDDVAPLYARILKLDKIELCGLMAIAPISHEHEPLFWYQKMQVLRSGLENKLSEKVPEMSMGMSGDFESAIACGATWIRIGTLIFGEREKNVKD